MTSGVEISKLWTKIPTGGTDSSEKPTTTASSASGSPIPLRASPFLSEAWLQFLSSLGYTPGFNVFTGAVPLEVIQRAGIIERTTPVTQVWTDSEVGAISFTTLWLCAGDTVTFDPNTWDCPIINRDTGTRVKIMMATVLGAGINRQLYLAIPDDMMSFHMNGVH